MPTGWVGSTRRETLPPDWEQRRRRRLEADGYRCQHVRFDTCTICGRTARDVDHTGDRLDHRHESLRSKCGWHHDEKTNREAGYASGRARRARSQSGRRKHPGLID